MFSSFLLWRRTSLHLILRLQSRQFFFVVLSGRLPPVFFFPRQVGFFSLIPNHGRAGGLIFFTVAGLFEPDGMPPSDRFFSRSFFRSFLRSLILCARRPFPLFPDRHALLFPPFAFAHVERGPCPLLQTVIAPVSRFFFFSFSRSPAT